MQTVSRPEQWDMRPLWRGIANGLVFSAFVWAAIAAVVWWAWV